MPRPIPHFSCFFVISFPKNKQSERQVRLRALSKTNTQANTVGKHGSKTNKKETKMVQGKKLSRETAAVQIEHRIELEITNGC